MNKEKPKKEDENLNENLEDSDFFEDETFWIEMVKDEEYQVQLIVLKAFIFNL